MGVHTQILYHESSNFLFSTYPPYYETTAETQNARHVPSLPAPTTGAQGNDMGARCPPSRFRRTHLQYLRSAAQLHGTREISSSFQAYHPVGPFWHFGAPRCLAKTTTFTRDLLAATPTSWLRGNPSAYLIDSGLWSACRESRRIIDKAFRRPEHHGHDTSWNSSTSDTDKSSNGLFALPAITSFATREGNVRRFLTVKPGQNLFIL